MSFRSCIFVTLTCRLSHTLILKKITISISPYIIQYSFVKCQTRLEYTITAPVACDKSQPDSFSWQKVFVRIKHEAFHDYNLLQGSSLVEGGIVDNY